MKQFIFLFNTDTKEWKITVEADGMYSALKIAQEHKKLAELDTNCPVKVKLQQIHYRHTA